MKRIELMGAIALIVVSVIVAAVFTIVATKRPLSDLEGVLLQAFSLGSGVIGSFIFGKYSARSAARELIKPHARSAFRRLLSLFRSLSRVASTIEGVSRGSADDHKLALSKLEAIVIEQLATADDALEDWRDIVPEDVDELRQQITNKRYSEDKS